MNTLETMNYLNDHRNRPGPDLRLWMDDPETGETVEIELPTKWDVCSVCNGEGKHVNPAIDCGGISAEAFHDDPDFADAYFGGTYDQVCNNCHGRTTERVVDWDQLTEAQAEAYEAQLQAEAECRAEHLAELRMGA